jgi:hypothetical protein
VDAIGVMTYDWVHNMFQNGVFTLEASLFIKACQPLGITRQHLCTFLKDKAWMFPSVGRRKAQELHRVFDEHRLSDKNPDKVKCSCAEALGLYGLLRHFFETRIEGLEEVRMEWKSFSAVCTVIDILLVAKRGSLDLLAASTQLQAAAAKHLRLHTEAYGTDTVVPKHHWMLDVPAQLRRDGMVLDTFVIERNHVSVKRIAEHIRNTLVYERSVMSGVTTAAFSRDAEASVGSGLVGRTAAFPGNPDATIADKMDIDSMEVTVADVILRGSSVGIVSACVCEGGKLLAIVEVLALRSRMTPHAGTYARTGVQDVWHASQLDTALAWYVKADGSIVVIYM